MYKSPIQLGAVVAVAMLVIAGCGGSGASTRANSTFRASIGAYPLLNVVNVTQRALLTRYQYTFSREVATDEELYYETNWLDATALDDERAIGVDFVRMRIIVSARPANRSPGSAGSMRTTMRAEVQYHVSATDQWKEADMTEGREAYFDEIADYLENELRVMLR